MVYLLDTSQLGDVKDEHLAKLARLQAQACNEFILMTRTYDIDDPEDSKQLYRNVGKNEFEFTIT